jgi:23S rRNA pseudouridine1911/1915/1917 synthase
MRQARPGEALHLAHRLDRYTSGVVLLARDAETNRYLKEAFRVRAVEKRYLAVVWGSPTWRDMLVDAPIGPHPASAIRLKMGVRPDGLPARTLFHVRARFSGMTLVECEPTTGRTHQIRVHLHSLGHPILGDRLYGQPEALFLHLYEHGEDERCLRALGLPRQALHAWRLALPHPDGGRLEIRAPLPEDLRELLRAGQAPQIVPYPDEEPPP